jgi:anti-sigma B factor antagonist
MGLANTPPAARIGRPERRTPGPRPDKWSDAMAEQGSRLKIREFQGISIVEFADRKILDELSILEIQDELDKLVEKAAGGNLLLSFDNVEHLSSAALGMLVDLKNKVEERHGKLRLSNINPQIFEVFKITRLNKMFQIHPSIDKARASF